MVTVGISPNLEKQVSRARKESAKGGANRFCYDRWVYLSIE